MTQLIPVVLSGGAGTRLWPVSREALPKPFIKLPGGESLLFKTARRARACAKGGEVLTITNREYFFLTRDEYEALGTSGAPFDFLLEPVGRNTAPAIAAAALHIARRHGENAIVLALPADHLIGDDAAFQAAVGKAAKAAADGYLVTFGVPPLAPETDLDRALVGRDHA